LNNELKEVILETLEEIKVEGVSQKCKDEEFLYKMRERLLVLFEGLQSPNLVDTQKKLDLTINFLEYTLAMIDKRLDESE
jgi:hypothetical protein